MKKKQTENERNIFIEIGQFIKRNASVLIIVGVAFILASLLAFFDVATSDTVVSYKLSDYEVGQIADKTIVAEKSLVGTIENPTVVAKGEKVTRKGFVITNDGYAKLVKMAETPAYIDFRAFANVLVYFILLFSLGFYLFTPTRLGRKIQRREIIMLSSIFIIVYAATAFCHKMSVFTSSYDLPVILPGTFCIILVTVLFGERDAVFFSFILSLTVAVGSSFDVVPMFFTLASCMTTTRIVRKMEKRIDLVLASLLIGALNAIFIFALEVIFSGSISRPLFTFLGVILNGFLSGILALGFMTPLEFVLNTASVFRLMDLSDLNSPVMRRMLLSAPGTYNHSLMVANLAESACSEIGANPLLARVGAYYHDLGKMEQPEYFVENQSGDNKHDDINPRLSVSVIRRHVKKGVEKAHQMRLPQEVIDIIAEHHGNSLISYFYNEAKKLDDQVSPEEYSYIGTPPSSRESAVVMLADTVEAACRTLEKPSVSRLERFIHQLIMAKFEHHQLDKSSLTFKDLDVIQTAFVKMLAGYYHSRIEYPNQKDPDAPDTPNQNVSDNNSNGNHNQTNVTPAQQNAITQPISTSNTDFADKQENKLESKKTNNKEIAQSVKEQQ